MAVTQDTGAMTLEKQIEAGPCERAGRGTLQTAYRRLPGDQHRLTPRHDDHFKLSACWAKNDPDRTHNRRSRGIGCGRDCRSRPTLLVADFQTGLSLAPAIDYSNRTENQEEHQDL